VDRPVARRARRALSLVLRLTKEPTGGPSTQIRVSPFRHISQKGDSIRAHMSLGFGADACMRMLADLRSPPNARHLGRWPRACTPTPHGTRHLRRAYGCCAPRAFPSRRLPIDSPSALTHPTGCVVCTLKACTQYSVYSLGPVRLLSARRKMGELLGFFRGFSLGDSMSMWRSTGSSARHRPRRIEPEQSLCPHCTC